MRSWCNPIGLLAVLSMLLAACAGAERTAPGHAVTADRQMVVAANPLAAAAGLEMLRAGGNAVDAAIATQMMLTLVEPQSSGLGGGGFLLHYDATTGEVTAYEGRETAPAAATVARMSTRSRVGLDGVSMITSAVSGRRCAPMRPASVMNSASIPHRPLPSR